MSLPFDLIADEGSRATMKQVLSRTADFQVLSDPTLIVGMSDYESGAVVPGCNWTRVDVEFKREPNKSSPFICLLDTRSMVKVLWELNCISADNIDTTRRNRAIGIWYDEVFSHYIEDRWGSVDGIQYIGAYSKRPHLDTTTVSYETGKRIGIHIDAWEKWHWSKTMHSKYRLCVNIGFTDRYFVFANTTAKQFVEKIGSAIDEGDSDTITDTELVGGTSYFRKHAKQVDLEFYKLRIAPGFAYLAPTDFIYHDGSTLGANEHTAQFTVRGYFQRSHCDWWRYSGN